MSICFFAAFLCDVSICNTKVSCACMCSNVYICGSVQLKPGGTISIMDEASTVGHECNDRQHCHCASDAERTTQGLRQGLGCSSDDIHSVLLACLVNIVCKSKMWHVHVGRVLRSGYQNHIELCFIYFPGTDNIQNTLLCLPICVGKRVGSPCCLLLPTVSGPICVLCSF